MYISANICLKVWFVPEGLYKRSIEISGNGASHQSGPAIQYVDINRLFLCATFHKENVESRGE